MHEIIIATSNKGKLKEFNEILNKYNIKCIGLEELCYADEIVEDGLTFKENAFIKGKTIFELFNKPVLSDDSGLCVKALNNAPGIHSARYMNLDSFDEKMDYILEQLHEQRDAFFNCTLCLYTSENVYYFEGILNGIISKEKNGTNGFGYDPIFIPNGYEKTLAQLDSNEKNNISHRSEATKLLLNFLNENNIF
ncbi:MAG: RdgB/HAM1 family non-canonical purine NTP pyrophosphatase [bacterium]